MRLSSSNSSNTIAMSRQRRAQSTKAARDNTRLRTGKRAAMVLVGAVLACGLTVSQVHAQAVLADRQLMPSHPAHHHVNARALQHEQYRRQSNSTGVGGSLSNTGTAGGGASTSATTTAADPPAGSSTTALDPSTSTTTEPPTSQTSTTTSGDLSNTQTTTIPTTTSSDTTTSSTTTSSDTTSQTSSTVPDVITTIITTTLDDGSVQTSASTASATSASDNKKDEDSGNHKAWIIPLSVVGEWLSF